MNIDTIRAYPTTTTCEIEMDVTLDPGGNYSAFMYYATGSVSAFSPEANFLRWEGSPSLNQTAFFDVSNLKTNTTYQLMGFLRNNNTSDFVRFYSSFTTFQDYSKIGYHYVENITTKSADVVVGVEVNELGGRTDTYKLFLDYSNFPITSPTNRQTIIVSTNNITEIIEKIFYLIRLRKKRKYYYKITLYNVNADEEIDFVTGEFKTLEDPFKIWMYLWYKL